MIETKTPDLPRADTPERRSAWQPFTFTGVASFAVASFSRLWFFQAIFALFAAVSVMVSISWAWLPVVDGAVDQLPPVQGEISKAVLVAPERESGWLSNNRFLAVGLDPSGVGELGHMADVEIIFGKEEVSLRSLLGYLVVPYSQQWSLPLNRAAVKPRWEAWKPALLAGVAATAFVWLLVVWSLLASLYTLLAFSLARMLKRLTTWTGSWRLSAAAQLPGALCMSVALLFYAGGQIALIPLLAIAVLHVPIGWVFGIGGVIALPKEIPHAATENPFAVPSSESAAPRNIDNPFRT